MHHFFAESKILITEWEYYPNWFPQISNLVFVPSQNLYCRFCTQVLYCSLFYTNLPQFDFHELFTVIGLHKGTRTLC